MRISSLALARFLGAGDPPKAVPEAGRSRYLPMIAAAFLTATAATAVEYECTITDRGRGGWMGEVVYFGYDTASGTGWAYDFASHRAQGGPSDANTAGSNSRALRFRWDVEGNIGKSDSYAKLQYSATLVLSTMRLSLRGTLVGYDNIISGSGKCRAVKINM